ncbi:MAG: hypothetical protein ABI199_01860 [Bacteroidia bacterium]
MKKKRDIGNDKPVIKVQLDYKTVMILRSLKSFDLWKEKYPDAKIIS